MDYPYNITEPWELISFTNGLVNNMLGVAILVMIFGVVFLSLKRERNNTTDSMVTSLWITTVGAILMSYLPGMLDGQIALLLIIITAMATVFMWRAR